MYTTAKSIIFTLLYLYSSLVYSQTSYTGNLVDNNWSNGYQVPELTCWGNEQGTTNCSPGGTPYIRPSGNINFSYSFTELYQSRAIADALPNSGTGLMVTGFQFNWTSKNGNGWDDGRQDQLSAYVQMYSKGGQWIEAQSYNLNFIHNWTDFSWSGTFSKERRGSDLGTILYGFSGKDNNYWLGPYGPEITNVSFSLRYQPDPCVVNPLHSTECPGFMAAINKPIPGLVESTANYSLTTTQSSSTTSSASMNTAMSVIKLNAQRDLAVAETAVEQATSTPTTENRLLSAGNYGTQLTSQARQHTTSSSTDTGQSVNEQDLGSTSNNAAPLIASSLTAPGSSGAARTTTRSQDTQTTGQEQEQSSGLPTTASVSVSATIQLPQVSRPVQRTDSQARSDTMSDAVSLDQMLAPPQINQQLATTTTVSLPPTPARSSTISQTQDVDTSAAIQVAIIRMPEITQVQADQSQSTLLERPTRENSTIAMPAVIQPAIAAVVVPEPPQIEFLRPPQTETTTVDAPTNTIATAIIDRTNPLNDMLNGQQQMAQSGPVFAGPAVKSNTADNDLADRASISQIARVPAGFDVYTNLAMREIAFYQPREIYRGQRTVDNIRALRSLGQDAKHQEMVDQQYRR